MTAVRVPAIPGLADALEPWADKLDLDLIERAWQASARAHRGQKRLSGDDAVSHGVAVARILVEQHMDSVSIACGLLHDVVEDTDVTIADVEKEFGPDIATIVDGLTKISTLQFRSSAEQQVENYRKLMVSVAKDARVIIVKLADRLHNMRTLEHLPVEKQRRIALETREIYAPLAHRFGMGQVRMELEDLAFRFLEPEEYRALARKVASRRADREALIERMREPLKAALDRAGIADVEITGRPKHLWSIFRKIQVRGQPYESIYDLMAIRVLVNSVPDCYHALGVIHAHWTPLQERIKDYIAQPKSNGYQSLHTTIFGPSGHLYEIQIRTREMHHTAEYGIAAHWLYKEGRPQDELDRHLTWFRQLLDRQQEAQTPQEFLEFLRIDLYQDEIFVFTPEGDVKQLPKGATPIDFAFAVHTEVGYHCQGAKVNGRIAPLHRQLKNGDTVEILTSPSARPSRDWLAHVRTGRARSKIRQWIRQEEHASSLQLGEDILAREVRRRRLEKPDEERLAVAARVLGQADGAHLVAALGRGDLATGQVIRALYPDLPAEQADSPPPPATMLGRLVERVRYGRGVRIQGVDGLMVRYSQCCQPVPGDSVTGYVTRGRGISIHRVDCPNLLMLNDPERRVELDWQEVEGEVFTVRLALTGEDRRGLYADVCTAVSQTGTNMKGVELLSGEGGMRGHVLVEVENLSHLNKVLKAIKRVKGVTAVGRREVLAD
ncbi:MAG TPA: bifunctional (p)ppGpp synthetase/guanosine-3',5'-bis(diphosphate) 3'-pyrophosphohydrolase [Gemmatimonadales bacterium]|nr:bifunctional (p)ppGpp synthetase/guanosine-3',5'-bis(diphosphate) 3'-pyrophosphohydrolase [Gemmatimonadales bacterium]